MTLHEELEMVLEELEDKGIDTTDNTYCRVKTIMTTINGIENLFLGVKR